MKFKLISLFISALLSSAVSAEVKVGVILPLTGDFGYFGEQVRQGISIAIDDLKASGAQVPELVFEDDKCLANDAVSAFRKLTSEEKVALIVGPACSTSIQSVAPIAKRSTTPVIFLLDTGEPVSSLPDPLYSFGFDPSRMAHALAADMHRRNLRRVAIVTEEEEYALLVSRAFEQKWKDLGGEIAASESVLLNENNYRSSLTKIMAKAPGAIFYSAAYNSGTFLKQLRALSSAIPVYGNDTMCTAETLDVAAAAANRARCGNVVLDETSTAVKTFRQALVTKFGQAPSSLFYAALGYDVMRFIQRELKLPAMSGKPLLGVEDRSADGVYDVIPSIIEIQDGKMVPIS